MISQALGIGCRFVLNVVEVKDELNPDQSVVFPAFLLRRRSKLGTVAMKSF